jgi:hypothetical protein
VSEVYLVHGFRMESEVELPALRTDGPADLRVTVEDPRPVEDGPPPGRVLASLEEDGFSYTVTDDGGALRVRVPGFAEFVVDEGRRRARMHRDPSADPGIESILICGSLPAALLAERGACVVHGSAVEAGGRAVAFVGGSGAGKSTLAAVLCSAGARLITDDLLRLIPHGAEVRAAAGPPEIRLRPAAAPLAAGLAGETSRTADGRTAIRLEAGPEAPLAAIIIPLPDREAPEVQAERLTGAEALVELGRYPRSVGWRVREVRAARFAALAGVSRAVPVFRARIPWGPPFAEDLAEELLGLAGLRVPT